MPFAINQFNCIDPDTVPDADECNSYSCPLGSEVGYAKVLMWKRDYDVLPLTHDCTLKATDYRGKTVTIPKLLPVSSKVILQTDASRTDAVVQVTLADLRWSYRNVVAGQAYNYRQSGGTFSTASQNSGSPWTWQGVVDNLWAKLVAAYGTYPSATGPQFPTAPAGTPEGFDFDADNVLDALNRVAQAAGYLLKYDGPTATISFVDPDNGAPAFPNSTQEKRTFDDGVWTDPTDWVEYARMPTSLRVVFPQLGSPDVASEDTTLDLGKVAGPKAVTWDDMPSFGTTNATARTNRAAAVAKLWQYDWLTRANPNRIEFLGWADWVSRANGLDGWSAWAVYDRGAGQSPNAGGLLSCISNLSRVRTEYKPDAAKYMPAGGSLNTQNVDGTALNAATTDIRANQASYITFTTTGGYQRLDIDTAGLCADTTFADCVQTNMTFDVEVEVPSCVSVVLTKTTAVVSGTTVLTDVSAAVYWKKRTITLPGNTLVGAEGYCVTAGECCPTGATAVTVACCPDPIPIDLTLTISGGGGSFPMTWSVANSRWETGSITVAGCGTINVTLRCTGTDASGLTIASDVGSNCNLSFSNVTRSCDPFQVQADGLFQSPGFPTCSCVGTTRVFTITT